MDARLTESELINLLPAASMRDAAEREALRHAAIAARDEAFMDGLRRLGGALGAAFGALAAWPAQRRLRAELMALTPRELADIGLTRADIPRVLEAAATAPAARPAAARPQPIGRARLA